MRGENFINSSFENITRLLGCPCSNDMHLIVCVDVICPWLLLTHIETTCNIFDPPCPRLRSIEQSLSLLKKLQDALHRENLQADLDEKYLLIFHNYGLDLSQVQDIYEKYKHNPPMPRNTPPVTGNILWSRHLLRRIQGEKEGGRYFFKYAFAYKCVLHAIDTEIRIAICRHAQVR